MKATYITDQLEKNINVFEELLHDVEGDLIKYRIAPDKWNLLEIVCHLFDEECEDFRARMKQVLENPELPFVPIDPPGWVMSRKYAEKDFFKTWTDFKIERKVSIVWLRGLKNPKWENAYIHPKFGPISAKYLLSNWLAHDYLHMRQIIRVKYNYIENLTSDNLNYAGTWQSP